VRDPTLVSSGGSAAEGGRFVYAFLGQGGPFVVRVSGRKGKLPGETLKIQHDALRVSVLRVRTLG